MGRVDACADQRCLSDTIAEVKPEMDRLGAWSFFYSYYEEKRAPLDERSHAWLRERWDELTAGAPHENGPLLIDGRAIEVRALAEGHAWCDFTALCEGPRAASDYIEIATEYHTVLVGGVPVFDAGNDDAARRFITAVDEFYDRHVNLVCTAAAAPPALHAGGRHAAAFARTASRLIEMQSADYLALPHRG
jgi:cell division protein ZapE